MCDLTGKEDLGTISDDSDPKETISFDITRFVDVIISPYSCIIVAYNITLYILYIILLQLGDKLI